MAEGINKIWQFFKPAYEGWTDPAMNGLKAFKNDWDALPEKDKEDLRLGIGNGSLTY